MLKLYNKYILPRLLNKGMQPAEFNETRSTVVSSAHGIVLEIGFGSGYNLPFYKNIRKFYALDPSEELYSYAKDRIASLTFPFEYLKCSAESIPLESNSVDTVVSTWSLCSIPDISQALKEIQRVLKPSGKFLFVEHGQSPNKIYSTVQRLITPITRNFTGNCHLDRKMDDFIKEAGLVIEKIEIFQEDGRPLMHSYRGIAVKK